MDEDINRIKTLRMIRDHISNQEYDRIKSILGFDGDEKNLFGRLSGFDNEDSFAETCYAMGTATHIIKLNNNPRYCDEYKVPDLFIRFQPGVAYYKHDKESVIGANILIEVKSTSKSAKKVSGDYLKKLRKAADVMGYPLFIATRFIEEYRRPFWIIKADDGRSDSVLFSYDEIYSCMKVSLWNDYNFVIYEDTIISFVFDKSKTDEIYAAHTDYGSLEKVEVVRGDASISFTGVDRLIAHLFFESFDLEQTMVEHIGSITIQYNQPHFIVPALSDVLFFMNNLLNRSTMDSANKYDGFPYIYNQSIIDRETVEEFVGTLLDKGLLLKYILGEPEEHLKLWEKYFRLA